MTTETSKKILIIEDEFSIAMDIEMRLQKMGYTVVGIANSYNDALPLLIEEDIDIALLDINLNSEKSGIDIGKVITGKFNIPIVFVTAYTDAKTFNNALAAEPMGFITKPFKDADLHNNIQLALTKFAKISESAIEYKTESQSIFIKNKGLIQQINIKEILWVSALDNYTEIHTAEGSTHIVHAFLKDVLNKLGDNFIRIHRSHAIALEQITTIDDNVVYLGNVSLIISQNYRSELISRMKLL